MNKTVVALVGIALLVAPAIPSLAQQGPGEPDDTQGDDRASTNDTARNASFEGDYWALDADPRLPGAANVSLVQADATLATAIELPGEDLSWDYSEDRARLSTSLGMLEARDGPDRELRVGTFEDDATTTIRLADGVAVENETEDEEARYRLLVDGAPDLVLTGDDVVRTEDGFEIGDGARLAANASQTVDERSSEDTRSASEEDRTRSDDEAAAEEEPDDRERSEPDERREQRTVTHESYRLGRVGFTLDNDTIEDLRLRNTTLFTAIQAPGLTPAEERREGPHLRLDGSDARVRLTAAQGLSARVDAEGFTAEIAPEVDVRAEEEAYFLSAGDLLVVVQGDDLELEGRTLSGDELRLNARLSDRPQDPVWTTDRTPPSELPYDYEGRYLSFTLEQDRLANLTVHGTPLGEVGFEAAQVDEIRDRGASLAIEGPGLEVRAADAPAVPLRLEAENLTTDVPAETTLPSGAQVLAELEEGELRISVHRPDDALANRTSVDHDPAEQALQRVEGPVKGLQAETGTGQLGVTSTDPATLSTQFDGQLGGVEGNVSVDLGLARAMLIDDTNANGRVDVGEPAVAESTLTEGTTQVEDDQLVSTFALWSGNLTVTAVPGNGTAKVTYEVHNLSAPPGTLFVLETRVQAPSDARLEPTDTGVRVHNGSLAAEYSAAGPVTVDGSDAWAQRSIFVDSNDTVRVLLAYPAGDDIVHDPTVSVQSTATDVVDAIAASPYAIVVGVAAAGLLVAGTVIHRRRQRPGRP